MSYQIGQKVTLKSKLCVEIVKQVKNYEFLVKCDRYNGLFRVSRREIVTLSRTEKLDII